MNRGKLPVEEWRKVVEKAIDQIARSDENKRSDDYAANWVV